MCLLDLEAGAGLPVEALLRQPADPGGDARAYRGGTWYAQTLVPAGQLAAERQRYRRHGVYVVIGGAGGIGEAWSRFMIEAYEARIVWVGRRPRDATIRAKQEALGDEPLYISADATDRAALEQAYREIKRRYGRVHGLVHSAIVLDDQSLATMDEERFRAALAAKMDVSVRMAQVFRDEVLDFVLFFSSLQSFAKSAGQSNYAAGCTFKDAFAHYLARHWPCAVKVMNWGYWGGAGVVASGDYRARMARAGVGSIEPQEGMDALTFLLNGPLDQVALMKTLGPRHADAAGERQASENEGSRPPGLPAEAGQASGRRVMAAESEEVGRPVGAEPPGATPASAQLLTARQPVGRLLDHVTTVLLEFLSGALDIAVEGIDVGVPFSDYGLDSILGVSFVKHINDALGLSLNTAVIFDYTSIERLAAHLVETHGDRIRIGSPAPVAVPAPVSMVRPLHRRAVRHGPCDSQCPGTP